MNGNGNLALSGLSDELIVVEPPTVTVTGELIMVVPLAAPIVAEAPPSRRAEVLGRLLETGAEAEEVYHTNITAQLFERRVQGLGDTLKGELASILKSGGDSVEHRVVTALHRHEKDLLQWTMRFLDPSSEEGIPTVAARKLHQVTDAAIKQVNALLADGDEGALAKWTDKITRQVQETERNILAQIAHRQAIANTGSRKGRNFEEAVSAKLAQISVAMGCQVERCSDQLGVKRSRHGDHVLALDPAQTRGETLRIVTEEKARAAEHRFTFDAVGRECQLARANREAVAAIFISETRDCLPDGVGFGQIGRADFFVHFDPSTGDDVGLVAALYLARATALQRLQAAGPGKVDRVAAKKLVDDIRDRVERRSRIVTYHGSAVKAINNASRALDEDTEAVLNGLARLDGILAA